MKNKLKIGLYFLIIIGLTSFGVHKFYVAIYQIKFVPEKKMIQIISRIFLDDLNDGIGKKYNTKTHIGDKNESLQDEVLLKKYISENFIIKVNGQQKIIEFKSKELENNILICYFTIKDISKIKTFEVQNTILFDFNSDQQNIIQTTIYDKKNSFLLTTDNVKGMLNQ